MRDWDDLDEDAYCEMRSQQESQSNAAWCIIAVLIIVVLTAIHGILG